MNEHARRDPVTARVANSVPLTFQGLHEKNAFGRRRLCLVDVCCAYIVLLLDAGAGPADFDEGGDAERGALLCKRVEDRVFALLVALHELAVVGEEAAGNADGAGAAGDDADGDGSERPPRGKADGDVEMGDAELATPQRGGGGGGGGSAAGGSRERPPPGQQTRLKRGPGESPDAELSRRAFRRKYREYVMRAKMSGKQDLAANETFF